MQIFVKHPINGATLVFDCTGSTTLMDLCEWIQIKTMVPYDMLSLRKNGKPIHIYKENDYMKTFQELGVQKEDMIYTVARMINR